MDDARKAGGMAGTASGDGRGDADGAGGTGGAGAPADPAGGGAGGLGHPYERAPLDAGGSSATETGGYHRKSTGDAERDLLLQRVLTAGRELGLGLLALNAAAAKAIGTHPTDAWIISYVRTLPADSPLSPGELAKLTGLTTGAITGVIDRLEKAGYVRRERDTVDRRKVIVVPTEAAVTIGRVFQPMVEAQLGLALNYSKEELAAIVTYMEGSIKVAEATVERLRKM